MTTKDLRNSIEKVLGNNIRCLLPSYWWKRLFHQVADTIDEVNGVDIVSSEYALNRIDAPIGSLASIANKKTMKPSEFYVPTDEDSNLTDEELLAKLTRLTGLEVSFPLPDITGVEAVAVLVSEDAWLGFLVISDGFCFAAFAESLTNEKTFLLTSQSSVNSLNTFLKQHKFYYVGLDFEPEDTEEYIKETTELYDQIFTIVDCTSDVYVKGLAWERLAKEGESGKEGEGDTIIPSYLLYYPYTTRNDVYTMHESFIEHNATELPKIKNSINNKEGYILNVVAAGTSATDVMTMQDVEFHYLGYAENTGRLAVITSRNIPVYRAVQTTRLFLGFKEDGTCEVKKIAVGDTLYLYYSEDYGFNFTDAEKAVNAENIIPIWNSLDESFTPRPIIIRHKVNDTPTGSGNYLSIPAVLTGVDTTGMNITLVGYVSPSRFLQYQYNRTTGEFVSLKEIVPDAELSDTSTNPVQNKVIKAYVDSKQAVVYFPEKEEDTLPQEMIASNATAFNLIKNRTSEQPINITVYGYSVNQYSPVGYYLHRYQSIQLMTFGLDTHVISVIPEHTDNLRKHVNTLMIYLHQGGSITLEKYDNYDAELSDTSINAVQNKVVTEKLASLEARIAALEGK